MQLEPNSQAHRVVSVKNANLMHGQKLSCQKYEPATACNCLLCVAMTARHIGGRGTKRPHCTLLLWMLLSIFVACFAACHRSSSSSKRRHATCANLFTVIVCCQMGGGRGSLSGPLFVGLHTLPTSLGSMPAKRLARLSSPASAYLDIIRSAALQPRTLTICVFNLPHAAAAANVLKIMQHAGMCGSLQFATRSDVKMSKSFTVRRLLIRAAEVAVRRRGAATATKTAAMATLATAAAATNFVATCNSGNWLSNMQCTVS